MEESGKGDFTSKTQIPCLSPALVCTAAYPRGVCVSAQSIQAHEVSSPGGGELQVCSGDGWPRCPIHWVERLKAPRSLPLRPQLLRHWAWTAPPCLFILPPPFSKHSTFSFSSLDRSTYTEILAKPSFHSLEMMDSPHTHAWTFPQKKGTFGARGCKGQQITVSTPAKPSVKGEN